MGVYFWANINTFILSVYWQLLCEVQAFITSYEILYFAELQLFGPLHSKQGTKGPYSHLLWYVKYTNVNFVALCVSQYNQIWLDD